MASIVETQSVKERRKAIFQLVWPATMESLLQYLVGLLATAMVGRLGAVAISATGLSNRVVRIPSALALMVTVGVTILIAQAIGAKRYEKVANLSYQALAISIIMELQLLIGFVYAGDI